jgi:phospholipase/carboxylesterase
MRGARWADLNVRVVGDHDGRGGGTGPVVVLLHGYGAPGDDLVPLAQALDVPSEVRFVFPEAHLMPDELAAYGGRAWWPIDMVALQRAIAEGGGRPMMTRVPEGMPEARARLIALLAQIEHELSVTSQQITLGGFSQGSMLACDVVLRTTQPFAGLALLSSTLVCAEEWQPLMAARRGLPVFQSHGTHDAVLPYERALAQRELLEAAGLDLTWLPFPGGHELPANVLAALGAFIRARA